MGRVVEAKRRVRIGNDPNNSRWARNEAGFGRRILQAQGWQDGSTLGARDASHSEFFTAGSSSHIKVRVRGEGVGIGFLARGAQAAEGRHPGMDVLDEVLARLNGKSETAISEERRRREDERRRDHVARKYGLVQFVSGGFLVGDKMAEPGAKSSREKVAVVAAAEQKTADVAAETEVAAVVEEEVKQTMEKERKKKRKVREGEDENGAAVEDALARKRRRKEERRAGKTRRKEEMAARASVTASTVDSTERTPSPASAGEQTGSEPAADKPRKKRKQRGNEEGSDSSEKEVDGKKSKVKRDKKEKAVGKEQGKDKRKVERRIRNPETPSSGESAPTLAATPSETVAPKPILLDAYKKAQVMLHMKALLAAEAHKKSAQIRV